MCRGTRHNTTLVYDVVLYDRPWYNRGETDGKFDGVGEMRGKLSVFLLTFLKDSKNKKVAVNEWVFLLKF